MMKYQVVTMHISDFLEDIKDKTENTGPFKKDNSYNSDGYHHFS